MGPGGPSLKSTLSPFTARPPTRRYAIPQIVKIALHANKRLDGLMSLLTLNACTVTSDRIGYATDRSIAHEPKGSSRLCVERGSAIEL